MWRWWIYAGAILGLVLLLGADPRSGSCPGDGSQQRPGAGNLEQPCASSIDVSVLSWIGEQRGEAVFASVGALATIAIAWFTWSLRQSTEKLWIASERQLNVAERSLVQTERAFIYMGDIDIRMVDPPAEPKVFRVFPMWNNGGTTVTRNLVFSHTFRTFQGGPGQQFAYPYFDPPSPAFLGPKALNGDVTIDIPYSDVAAAEREGSILLLWVRADYGDVFPGTHPHFTEYTFRLFPRRDPKGDLWVERHHFGPNNRTDDDT